MAQRKARRWGLSDDKADRKKGRARQGSGKDSRQPWREDEKDNRRGREQDSSSKKGQVRDRRSRTDNTGPKDSRPRQDRQAGGRRRPSFGRQKSRDRGQDEDRHVRQGDDRRRTRYPDRSSGRFTGRSSARAMDRPSGRASARGSDRPSRRQQLEEFESKAPTGKRFGELTQSRFDNIYFSPERRSNSLLTPNLGRGKPEFAERLLDIGGVEYREWDPKRSKLAAGIRKGISQICIREGSIVLYLGASHGYTPSYVSDIVGEKGFVFCVEFAPNVAKNLVMVCERRKNMAPILADAFHPERYASRIIQPDVVYQDVAQKNQVDIFLKNMRMLLKSGGFGVLAVKARSIDVAKRPSEIFNTVLTQLEKEVIIVDKRTLDPFERDHMLIVCKKK